MIQVPPPMELLTSTVLISRIRKLEEVLNKAACHCGFTIEANVEIRIGDPGYPNRNCFAQPGIPVYNIHRIP
jgi:hypothetical protein